MLEKKNIWKITLWKRSTPLYIFKRSTNKKKSLVKIIKSYNIFTEVNYIVYIKLFNI